MNSPLGMEKCGASLFDKRSTGFRKFHDPSLFPREELKAVQALNFGDLFTQCGLSNPQYLSGSREVQFFCQNDNRL
jgi:hypothetical protein